MRISFASLRFPCSGGNTPAINLINVDLPAPLGPNRPIRSPGANDNLMPDNKGVYPYPTAILSKLNNGAISRVGGKNLK